MIKNKSNKFKMKEAGITSADRLYSSAILACAVIHVVYLILFLITDTTVLVLANLIGLFICLLLLAALRKGWFTLILCVIHTQILLHAVSATVYLGWGYGFEYIILSILTMEIFFVFRNTKTPHLLRAAEILVFILLRVYTLQYVPLYTGVINGVSKEILFFFNLAIFFAALVSSSVLSSKNNKLSWLLLEENNKHLQKLAEIDPLTNLLNRRSMIERLEDAVKRKHETSEDFCLAMCDIDDFKQINDAYGHACGDYVLKMLSATICEYLDESDVVCRWGGEEILVLLRDTTLETAIAIVEGLRRAIETTSFVYDGAIISLTMTMGVCSCKEDTTAVDMINEADRYMYNGKRSGKNCVKLD